MADTETSNAYMDAVVANRSVLLSEEESLAGQTLLSAETCAELNDEECFVTWLQENFADFMTHLRRLPERDQDLMLAYYMLRKSQTQLSAVHKSTQTVISYQLRAAKRVMVGLMRFGGQPPTVEDMKRILKGRDAVTMPVDNYSKKTRPMNLAVLLADFNVCHNYERMAGRYKLHRPAIRRAFSDLSKLLIACVDPDEQILGWWIYGITAKANPAGSGLDRRAVAKQVDMKFTTPNVCVQFRIRVDDPGFDQLFQS